MSSGRSPDRWLRTGSWIAELPFEFCGDTADICPDIGDVKFSESNITSGSCLFGFFIDEFGFDVHFIPIGDAFGIRHWISGGGDASPVKHSIQQFSSEVLAVELLAVVLAVELHLVLYFWTNRVLVQNSVLGIGFQGIVHGGISKLKINAGTWCMGKSLIADSFPSRNTDTGH
ncbi:hypothetical protein Dimus_029835 [Dionaea muscipula]